MSEPFIHGLFGISLIFGAAWLAGCLLDAYARLLDRRDARRLRMSDRWLHEHRKDAEGEATP